MKINFCEPGQLDSLSIFFNLLFSSFSMVLAYQYAVLIFTGYQPAKIFKTGFQYCMLVESSKYLNGLEYFQLATQFYLTLSLLNF